MKTSYFDLLMESLIEGSSGSSEIRKQSKDQVDAAWSLFDVPGSREDFISYGVGAVATEDDPTKREELVNGLVNMAINLGFHLGRKTIKEQH